MLISLWQYHLVPSKVESKKKITKNWVTLTFSACCGPQPIVLRSPGNVICSDQSDCWKLVTLCWQMVQPIRHGAVQYASNLDLSSGSLSLINRTFSKSCFNNCFDNLYPCLGGEMWSRVRRYLKWIVKVCNFGKKNLISIPWFVFIALDVSRNWIDFSFSALIENTFYLRGVSSMRILINFNRNLALMSQNRVSLLQLNDFKLRVCNSHECVILFAFRETERLDVRLSLCVLHDFREKKTIYR